MSHILSLKNPGRGLMSRWMKLYSTLRWKRCSNMYLKGSSKGGVLLQWDSEVRRELQRSHMHRATTTYFGGGAGHRGRRTDLLTCFLMYFKGLTDRNGRDEIYSETNGDCFGNRSIGRRSTCRTNFIAPNDQMLRCDVI